MTAMGPLYQVAYLLCGILLSAQLPAASSPYYPWWEPPTSADLILGNGYPVEQHDVQTEDGYILRVYRIPYGKNDREPPTANRPALLLQHGILCSSSCWLIPDPHVGLGYRLADSGYDVWMGNSRGNIYSRKHISLSPSNAKFWDFSFQEMGYYDLPAMIDYMLNYTGQSKLTYVAHSQGTTQFFALASMRPNYMEKIRVMSALGPVAFLDSTKGLVSTLAHHAKLISFFADALGIHHLLDRSYFQTVMDNTFCGKNSIFQFLCDDLFFIITGFDSPQMNKSLVKPIGEQCPTGCSVKQLKHFAQLCNNGGKFTYYDYGVVENLMKYKSISPPVYNLRLAQVPIYLHYGSNDYIASSKEVDRLSKILPNATKVLVPDDQFNHLDFMWAKDANILLYDNMISLINKYLP